MAQPNCLHQWDYYFDTDRALTLLSDALQSHIESVLYII